MAEIEVQTYQDAVDHLADVFELDRHEILLRRMKRAVKNAYRRLLRLEHWAYFERQTQIQTVAAQTTGSLSYDHAGGAHDRLVTLSGATVPDDVRFYVLLIGTATYKIEAEISSTEFTLAQDTNPGEDLAAGTSYALARSTWPLPLDFRSLISRPVDPNTNYRLRPLEPDGFLQYRAVQNQPGEPYFYQIRNAGEFYGGMCLELAPPPNAKRTYDIYYDAGPRPLLTYRDTGGTATINSGSNALTLSGGGSLKNRHKGAIVRLSSTATAPTGLVGDEDSDNPYAVQRVLLSVDSATEGTLDAAVDTTYANVGYTISDPLDIEGDAMSDLFNRLCEVEFERVSRMRKEDWIVGERDIKNALIEAQCADNRIRDMRQWDMSRDMAIDVFDLDVELNL